VLSELRVRQLGVIDDLTVAFGPGMTALTGETGAGKTLLVEALALVLGCRADAGMVRTGAEEALVEARFVEADDETIVARGVPSTGRSRAWVNGRMTPVSALAEVADGLADIHGQGEYHALVHGVAQRHALDAFGGLDPVAVDELRHRVKDVERRLEELGGDVHQRARDMDVLSHQIAEIETADLGDPREDAALVAEEERLGDLAALREAAARSLGALDAEGAVLDLLGAATAALEGRKALQELEARLRSSQAELADVASDLRTVAEEWEDDPGRLDEVQHRRRVLSDLYRKYGGDRDSALAFADLARERLDRLRRAEDEATELEGERHSVTESLTAAERALLAARSEAAPRLAQAVERRLADLAMAGARFEVRVDDAGAGDAITFLLSANTGEVLRPLARAASGGELARTMLALRLVAPGGPPTMVFDEVDAGVGGTAALALAQALREVAKHRQVLVVTHLAQVAAFADHQISVAKAEEDGRVTTSARALAGGDRVVEISRMLSGHPDSARARAHAEELLALAGTGAETPPPGRRRAIKV
jgi:DNA repair protein RecN (Recombination protein N)